MKETLALFPTVTFNWNLLTMARLDGRTPITVLEGHDFAAWQVAHANGACSGELPFGIEALERFGFSLRHNDAPWNEGWLRTLMRRQTTRLGYQFRADGAISQVLHSLPGITDTSLVISIFEEQGLPYLALAQRITRLPPLVMMTQWLTEHLAAFSKRKLKKCQALARKAKLITVFSGHQVKMLAEQLELDAARIKAITFGVDTDFYQPVINHDGPSYVAAVGSPKGRDWRTLLAAAAELPQIRFKLATDLYGLPQLRVPANVEVLGRIDHRGYRQLLQEAEFVVVPTGDLAYPAGSSVLLEGFACGRPAIVTRTAALFEYAREDATLLCDVGNVSQLKRGIETLHHDVDRRVSMGRKARQLATNEFDSHAMWEQVAALMRDVLS